jgi:hypothetical protein
VTIHQTDIDEWYIMNNDSWWDWRGLTDNEVIKYTWGECYWTARILAQGEIAGRGLQRIRMVYV